MSSSCEWRNLRRGEPGHLFNFVLLWHCIHGINITNLYAFQPDTAIETYLQALNQSKFCDVVFTFENCEERIEAHQFVLRMRSPVFVAILRGQGSNVGNMREVKIDGTSHLIFREFLEVSPHPFL